MSWSDLLRKMKDEIEDIEFNQVPTLSTSRELDLTKPFSIVPESFDRKTGKKRSLLIGCNYESLDQQQLKASHDDISSMKVSSMTKSLKLSVCLSQKSYLLFTPLGLFGHGSRILRRCRFNDYSP